LLYARLGGVTVHAARELSFGPTLDNSIYTADMMPPVQLPAAAPLMSARLTLRNTGQPIALTFPSGQSFDLEVRNDRGTVVYRWSDGQAFTQMFRSEIFGPGEKNFVVQVHLLGPDKKPLPKGGVPSRSVAHDAGRQNLRRHHRFRDPLGVLERWIGGTCGFASRSRMPTEREGHQNGAEPDVGGRYDEAATAQPRNSGLSSPACSHHVLNRAGGCLSSRTAN
jgi:hypothetical protein